jgi:stress response protein SCP2
MEELVKLEDAKLYLYMTSNGTDITINLTGNEVDKQITIKLDDIIDKLVQKYNIVVLISRKYRSTDDDDYSGFNYI